MNKRIIKLLTVPTLFVLTIFLLVNSVDAHPGGTDAYGCHTCRTNCPSWGLAYGEYHCHNAKALPQPEPPIRSRKGNPGYTEPASDYAVGQVSGASTSNDSSGSDWLWWVLGIGGVLWIGSKFSS